MRETVLYLGDTALKAAGSYLAGVMSFYKIGFEYLASSEKFADNLLSNDYTAVIISDYPAGNFSGGQLESLAERVNAGMGLLMIGGWESFTGANREYTDTALKEVLPVIMASEDDRVNCFGPCLIEKTGDHPIVNSLPFDNAPPGIGGFNRVTAKGGAAVILCARMFQACRQSETFSFVPANEAQPLLVIGSYGKGRVTAFATDVAPHWVGGLVDWGCSRVNAQAPGANAIEVGNWYARFLANMVNWTAGKI